MYEKIKKCFLNSCILIVGFSCIWNAYTIIFHGYVTNGFWETYYEEEPLVFALDSIEVLWYPLFLSIFPLLDYFSGRSIVNPSKVNKAKRLRRKKRKKKRKV